MNESFRYNIEWRKPDTKKYPLCDYIYMKIKNSRMLIDDKSQMEMKTGDRDDGRWTQRNLLGILELSYIMICMVVALGAHVKIFIKFHN